MRYISIFSGIEAASVAWEPLGWTPVAFSEIDDFPSAVLRKHYPTVPNLGDITKVDWTPYRGTVDLVIGGSPCQSFSVAGKREGLAGASGLMYEYIRCIYEIMPSWLIWENVPGALSSERGGAFGQLLASLDECGYGLAWRVLDAQFYGVAQRRRRVFLVGHIGDQRAAQVLFEPESVCWDTPTSADKRQALAACSGRRFEGDGRECLTPWDVQSKHIFSELGVSPTLNSGTHEGQNIMPSVLTFAQNTCNEVRIQGDGTISGSLSAQPGMKQQTYVLASDHAHAEIGHDVSPTVLAHAEKAPPTLITANGGYVVRRLTPTECERLQGFPDGYTDIGQWIDSKGKKRKTSDGARYRALGNSFAVPCVRWLGERIELVQRITGAT